MEAPRALDTSLRFNIDIVYTMKSRKNTRLRTKTRKRRQTRTRKRRQRGGSETKKKVVFNETQQVARFKILEDGNVELTISKETANIPCEVCQPDESAIMHQALIKQQITEGVNQIFIEDIAALIDVGFIGDDERVDDEKYKKLFVSAQQLKDAMKDFIRDTTIDNPLPQTIYRTLLKIIHQGNTIPDDKTRYMNAAVIQKMIAIYLTNMKFF